MEMKKCSECGRLLPITEFNLLRRSKDGHQDRCRECFSKYNKKRYAANRERTKLAVRKYREENPGNELDTRIRKCEKSPTHKNAYRAVDAAIRAGVLEKPAVCSMCGRDDTEYRIEAHHYDYTKPLDVIWLCSLCHDKADQERRVYEGKPPTATSKRVVMLVDGKPACHFDSIVSAARAVRRKPHSLVQCLKKTHATCAGFEWAYEQE